MILPEIFEQPLEVDGYMLDLIPQVEEEKKCGGEGGKPGPCPEGEKPEATQAEAKPKLEEVTESLSKEVKPELEKNSKLRDLYNSVKDKVTGLAKTLYAGELPAWGIEHCDLWIRDEVLTVQSGHGGTMMALKVASLAATKAYIGVRGLLKRSISDIKETAQALHTFMLGVSELTKWKVPTIEELETQLQQESEAKTKALTKELKPINLKSSEPLEEALKAFWHQQAEGVLNRLKSLEALDTKAPIPHFFDIAEATTEMFNTMLPLVKLYYDYGAEDTVSRLGLDTGILKVVQPNIELGAKQTCLGFCQATNDSTSKELGQAIQELRESLAEGLTAGEYKNALMARVQEVFDSLENNHAFIVGVTEASRAQHAAMNITNQASGIVKGYKWLASANCCDECQELDGKEVELDTPFVTKGDGPYDTVPYPPAHPSCRCAVIEVI